MNSTYQKLALAIASVVMNLAAIEARSVQAASFTFTKIIDSNTPIPGQIVTFDSCNAPALDGRNVAFSCAASIIYTSIDSSLSKVADTNTAIPNSTGNFLGFPPPAINGESVVFTGIGFVGQLPQVVGIYTNIGGSLTTVADINTAIPNGTGNFTNFGFFPAIEDENVVFLGFGSNNQAGIYANRNGLLATLADISTAIPDGRGNFGDFFTDPVIGGGNVAFVGGESTSRGGNLQEGIYIIDRTGSLSTVVDRNTAIPDRTTNFTQVFYPAISGDNVVFTGTEGRVGGEEGVYARIGGSLITVANNKTATPEGTGNFGNNFGYPAIDGNNVAFINGATDFQSAIYTTIGGSLIKLIARNDILDGKVVGDLGFGSNGLSGNSVVFGVGFTDGSTGIYRADLVSDEPTPVPEPDSVLGLLAISALGVGLVLNKKLAKSRRA